MKRNVICLAAIGLLAFAASAQAFPIMLTSFVPVTDDFNGMITSGSTTMSGTVGLVQSVAGSGGFDATKVSGTGTVFNLFADAGTANSGAAYSDGTGTTSDRALGLIASGTTIGAFGVEIQNSTGFALTSVSFSFSREQWRSSTSTTNILSCASAVSGGTANSSNYLNDAGVTLCPTLDMVGEAPVTANGALDGNVHSVLVSGSITVAIPNGSSLFVRWTDTNDVGNDANLAIDDLTVTGVPEPATMGVLGLGGLFLVRRRRA